MTADRAVSRCGCVVERHACGLFRNVYRCMGHQDEVRRHPSDSLEHYVGLGCIVEGIPQHRRYIAELTECLTEMGVEVGFGVDAILEQRRVVEIGAGLGMYAPLFLGRGYQYAAIEPVPYAAEWVRSAFNVEVHERMFDGGWWPSGDPVDAVMAAHVLEHLPDALHAAAAINAWLKPGGRLYMIVPDASDLWNPEHVWFGDEPEWRGVLAAAGFDDIRCATRKSIERERFLYFAATRPCASQP